jgi:hypothetical protein
LIENLRIKPKGIGYEFSAPALSTINLPVTFAFLGIRRVWLGR